VEYLDEKIDRNIMGNATEMIYPDGTRIKQDYDVRGNRLTSSANNYAYNGLNQLTASDTHTFKYDADGNLIEEQEKATGQTKKTAGGFRTVFPFEITV
jgi:YD repeat-containing protein